MNEAKFKELVGAGYNRIPVWRSVMADLDTPLSVYLKLADGPNTFLLESVQGGENWGRYSIIGLPCDRAWQIKGHDLIALLNGQVVSQQTLDDPLDALSKIIESVHAPQLDELAGFSGGLVGYFGYEIVGLIEPRLAMPRPEDTLPDVMVVDAKELAVFDNLSGRLNLIVTADPTDPDAWAKAQQRLDQLVNQLRDRAPSHPPALNLPVPSFEDFESDFDQQAFEKAVLKAKEYILAGDVMQVVLSQRMRIALAARPIDVYRALRSLNPSPYMYFFDFEDFHVVGASPEVLVRIQDKQAMVRPIAGTRPRGKDAAEDLALEAELKADPKELAEHLMLIDLGRNDIGRISKTGSVTLTDQMVIERYSHVMHLVSEVHGEIEAGTKPMDVLKATFPAGTLSGAPKVRAMEIIQELEPVRREIYAGAVGYFNWHQEADLAIAIRTAIVKDGILQIQAGAGIVADSDPRLEWEETLNKGRAVVKAVIEASGGEGQTPM